MTRDTPRNAQLPLFAELQGKTSYPIPTLHHLPARERPVSRVADCGATVCSLVELLAAGRPEVHVRRAIMVAFGQIGSPRTEALVRLALSDEDAEVRRYAAEALKRVTRPEARP